MVLYPFTSTNLHMLIPVCCHHLNWAASTCVRYVPLLDCDVNGTSG